GLRHEARVLELGRKRAVDRRHRPLVDGVDLDLEATEVHHRFDREDHPSLEALAAASLAVVFDLRIFVEAAAGAVTDEVTNDAAVLSLDVLLNRRADVAKPSAVANLGDAELEGAARDFDDVPCILARRADVERCGRVAVEAVVEGRDVDVDDVAV